MEKEPIIVKQQAVVFEIEYGLPALTGSDRQIAWGRNIRAKWLSRAFDQILTVKKDQDLYDVLNELRNQKNAGKWIDIRATNSPDCSPLEYLTTAARFRKEKRQQQAEGIILTVEMIDSLKSPKGGWTKRALEILGVGWPPPRGGWKAQLTGSTITKERYDEIMRYARLFPSGGNFRDMKLKGNDGESLLTNAELDSFDWLDDNDE